MTRPGSKLTDRTLSGDEQDEPRGRPATPPAAAGEVLPRPGVSGLRGRRYVACQSRDDTRSASGRFIDGPPFGGPIRTSNCVAPLAAGRELVVISRCMRLVDPDEEDCIHQRLVRCSSYMREAIKGTSQINSSTHSLIIVVVHSHASPHPAPRLPRRAPCPPPAHDQHQSRLLEAPASSWSLKRSPPATSAAVRAAT